MLSPGEISQMNSFNPLEPNIDIYVHTFVSPGNRINPSPQISINNVHNSQLNEENISNQSDPLITNMLHQFQARNSQNQISPNSSNVDSPNLTNYVENILNLIESILIFNFRHHTEE